MNTLLKLAASFVAGAAVMYYLDPATGRRRRALVRDQGAAAGHGFQAFTRAKARHATDRVRGAIARTRAKATSRPLDDATLHEQIRSKLGHVIAHPGTVEVQVQDGQVVLRGSAQREEIDALSGIVAGMRGVRRVDNRLMPELARETRTPGMQEARH